MATSSATPPPDPQSFTTMDKDVEAIGAHCQYTFCNQLDFLPFRCESCRGTYCLDHRTESSHKCTHTGEWAAARRKQASSSPSTQKPTLATGTQCSHPACKTYINSHASVAVGCQTCNRQYCLKHRFPDDHACSTLTAIGARPSSTTTSTTQTLDNARSALSRLRAWGKEKAATSSASSHSSSRTSTAASRTRTLSALRKSAKGDAKTPPEKRIYLHVEAEAQTTRAKFPKGDFWYNKEWSVGRMLDEAAKALQVQNVNNRGGGEEQRLRVFHVEAGRLLEFGERVGEGCGDGNTVVLLRGVGPAGGDMIEL